MAFSKFLADLIGGNFSMPGVNVPWDEISDINRFNSKPLEDYYRESEEESGLVPTADVGTLRDMNLRRQETEDVVAREREKEAQKQKLYDAARQQDEWVQSRDYEPSQEFSDPDRGILVRDMDPAALLRMRAQANAKSRMGNLKYGGDPTEEDYANVGKGGSFFATVGQDPATQQRIADRDKWAQGQDLRDARYEADLARTRRDQPGQELAANKIASLKQQNLLDRRQGAMDKIAQSMVDGAGKVPFEKAMQLQLQGVHLPPQIVGTSKEDVINQLDGLIAEGRNSIASSVGKIGMTEQQKVRNTFDRAALPKIQWIREMVANGRMTPDEATKQINDTLGQQAKQYMAYMESLEPLMPIVTEGE